MTRRYTAADFANAKFAEHPAGGRGHRIGPNEWRLGDSTFRFYTEEMIPDGWVPVPTKPTITDSEVGEIAEHKTDGWLDGFITGYQKAGGTILDETPRERVARLVNEMVDGRGIVPVGEKVADRLIDLGLVEDK